MLIPLEEEFNQPTLIMVHSMVPPGSFKLKHALEVEHKSKGMMLLPMCRMSGTRDEIKSQLVALVDRLFDAMENDRATK